MPREMHPKADEMEDISALLFIGVVGKALGKWVIAVV